MCDTKLTPHSLLHSSNHNSHYFSLDLIQLANNFIALFRFKLYLFRVTMFKKLSLTVKAFIVINLSTDHCFKGLL